MGRGTRRAVRHSKKRLKLPPDAKCTDCESTRLLSLVKDGDEVRCYRCLARKQGHPTIEGHHFISAALTPDAVIPVPANDHRAIEDAKYDFPEHLWTNPDGRVVLMAVAVLFMAGALGHVLYRYGPRLARLLLALSERLAQQVGPDWEDRYGLTPFAWEDPADTDPIL